MSERGQNGNDSDLYFLAGTERSVLKNEEQEYSRQKRQEIKIIDVA